MAIVKTATNVLRDIRKSAVIVAPGSTISECYQSLQCDPFLKPTVAAFHKGIIQKDWGTVVGENETVIFAVIPAGGDSGGKTAMAAIAMIAIMIIAPQMAAFAVQGMGGSTAAAAAAATTVGQAAALQGVLGMSYATSVAVIGTGISMIGAMAIGAMFKPSLASMTSPVMSQMTDPVQPSHLIVGQSNQARPGGMIPVIFGRHTIFPDLAAITYIEKEGCKQTLHAIYCCGYGNMVVFGASAKLGGRIYTDLAIDNPGMQINITNLSKGAYKPKWYKGRREVDVVNQRIVSADGSDTYPIIVNAATSGALEVYLDIVFPAGIYNVSDRGEVENHTASISIYRRSDVTASWVPLAMTDLIENFSLICKGEDKENNLAEGLVTDKISFEDNWAKVQRIVDRGTTGVEHDDVEVCEPRRWMCGEASWLGGKNAGWNAGIAGHPGPNFCVDNGFNATPLKGHLKEAWYAYLTNPAKNGAFYYTIKKDSYSGATGASVFPQGVYYCTLTVKNPGIYTPGTYKVGIKGMVGSFWVRQLDAVGNYVGALTKVDQRVIDDFYSTNYSVEFHIEAASTVAAIQVTFMFDLLEGRTPASRRSAITLEDMSILYHQTTSTAVVEEESIIRIAVPKVASNGKGVSIPDPRPGDVLSFARMVEGCDTASDRCIDMGYSFLKDVFYDPNEEMGMPEFSFYRYAEAIDNTEHRIMRVDGIRTDEDPRDDQAWAILELGLDDPIDTTGELIYTRRLLFPGFRVTSSYRGPIHLGLKLKYYSSYKLAYETVPPARAVEECTLASISSIRPALPQVIVPQDSELVYTLIEIKVPASDQIGHTLKPFSVDVHRKMRSYAPWAYHDNKVHGDPSQPARADSGENPAWTYLSVLLGPPGGLPLNVKSGEYLKDYIDIGAFRRWADMCIDMELKCTYISTGYSTIGELLSIIAATGRGRSTFVDNRHSIIFDGDPAYFTGSIAGGDAAPIVRQVITPENSWNGSSKMTYLNDTHALKITYTDTLTSQPGEQIIYAPNFAKIGHSFYKHPPEDPPWKAEKFETLALPGVGYKKQAGILGEYFMDEVRLRRERCVRSMDVDALICREGHIVAVQDDVMKLGGKAARVVTVHRPGGPGSSTLHVKLDDPMPNMNGIAGGPGIRIRYFDNPSSKPALSDIIRIKVDPKGDGDNGLIEFAIPSGVHITIGSMILWGEVTRISQDFQITSIKYSADGTAVLEMLEYYPDPMYYEGDRVSIGESPVKGEVNKPENIKVDVRWSMAAEWIGQFYLSWDAVKGLIGESGYYRVQYTNYDGVKVNVITTSTHHTGERFNAGCVESRGSVLFKIFAVDGYGNESEPGEELGNVETPSVIIGNVEEFEVDVSSGSTILAWKGMFSELYKITFEIRYASDTDSSASGWDVGSNWIYTGSGNTFDAGDKRSGIYYIKAFGPCGTESEAASMIIVDLVSTTDKSPFVYEQINFRYVANPGSFRNCIINPVTCKMVCEVYLGSKRVGFATGLSFNTTNYIAILDTNESGYPSGRCKHKKDEHGYCFLEEGWLEFSPDLMANHIPPNSECYIEVEGGGGAYHRGGALEKCPRQKDGFANVYHYYRTWSGSGPATGQYRLATGGLVHVLDHIQFASKIVSEDSDVTPMITQTIVGVSYKSRTESDNNIKFKAHGPSIGLRITYNTPFQIKPAISILGQELKPGDYWEITQDKPEGFTIKFYNSTGATRDASFDWIANGYGAKR